jgi:hypothetical protein
MSDKNRLTLIILAALAFGYGVSLKFELGLTPPSRPDREEPRLLRAEDGKE